MSSSVTSHASSVQLPLVSVVVVNFNYARYLEEAVVSVVSQSYPNIEVIVVDNASTDDSPACLARIEARFPGVRVIRRDTNGGQSVASKEGFEATRGEYVVFLDADDVLLERCVEAHVHTHLSLRLPIGFTSVDMYQTVDGRAVVSTSPGFGAFVASGIGRRPEAVRPVDAFGFGAWPLAGDRPVEPGMIHLVDPVKSGPWVWSPTSGNCFRRDALKLFLNNDAFGAMRSGTDAYLLRGIGTLTGSALIDIPLACYRLHGSNVFTLGAPLVNVATYSPQRNIDNNLGAMRALIDHIFAQRESLIERMPSIYSYKDLVVAISETWPTIPSSRRYPSYAAELACRHLLSLRKLGGDWAIYSLLCGLRINWLRAAIMVLAQRLRSV